MKNWSSLAREISGNHMGFVYSRFQPPKRRFGLGMCLLVMSDKYNLVPPSVKTLRVANKYDTLVLPFVLERRFAIHVSLLRCTAWRPTALQLTDPASASQRAEMSVAANCLVAFLLTRNCSADFGLPCGLAVFLSRFRTCQRLCKFSGIVLLLRQGG